MMNIIKQLNHIILKINNTEMIGTKIISLKKDIFLVCYKCETAQLTLNIVLLQFMQIMLFSYLKQVYHSRQVLENWLYIRMLLMHSH